MIIQSVVFHSWFQANPEYPFCTRIKETITWNIIVWSVPSHGSPSSLRHNAISHTHIYCRPPLWVFALHSLLPYSDKPLPISPFRPPTDWLRLFLSQPFSWINNPTISFRVDKKNQLDVTFCILYFSSNSCSTCFGQPCAHHQELTTAWCYSFVLVCAVAAGRWSSPVGR